MAVEWCPFAIQVGGPPSKQGYVGYPPLMPKRGQVNHSAEGYLEGLHQILNGTARKSWQFTITYNTIEQHYAVSANCWHAGDTDDDGEVKANIDLVGIEHLGVAGEALTQYQIDANIRLTKWLGETNGYHSYARYPYQENVWTLAEHNQVGDAPTDCPSGRIPWSLIIPALAVPTMNVNDMEDLADLRMWRQVCGAVDAMGLFFVPVGETTTTLTFEVRLQRNTARPETRTTITK